LLTWEGLAANAELIAQTLPHSRRNDTIETTVHYKRLQRPSRFRFFPMLSQVLGMRSGKPGRAAPVALPESTIVVPAALAVELAVSHQRDEQRRRPPARRGREGGREPRRTGDARRRDESRRRDEPRRARAKRPEPQAETAPVAEAAAAAPAPEREKKRRRSRRRSRKPSQKNVAQGTTTESPELPLPPGENEDVPVVLDAGDSGAEGAPRKKSRRGRRGGRGRRRGPRGEATTNNGEAINDSGASAAGAPEAPPPPVEG
jgi:ribonuclease E